MLMVKFESPWSAIGIAYHTPAFWFNLFYPRAVRLDTGVSVSGAAHSVIKTHILQFLKMKSALLEILPVVLVLSIAMTHSKSKPPSTCQDIRYCSGLTQNYSVMVSSLI